MGVQNGNLAAGTAIITGTCDGSFNQFWAMDPDSGAPNTFLLRNEANPKECLSVPNKSMAIGAPLVIWPCKAVTDNQDQRWRRAGQFAVPIYNFNSGLQILGSGPKGSAVLQRDGRVPFTWMEGEVVIA